MNISIEKCPVYTDKRGDLVQFITHQVLQEKNIPFGQIYILTFNGKNIVRGNHYHEHLSEAFCLIEGEVEIVLEDVETKERFSQIFRSDGEATLRISIGPKIAHAIKSVSDSAFLMSYASKIYDPLDEDKFSYHLL